MICWKAAAATIFFKEAPEATRCTGARADTLDGGAGNDTLSGGVGNDVFLFATGGGKDIITDFALGDLVEISGYTSAQSIVPVGTDVVVTLSSTDKVILQNATLSTSRQRFISRAARAEASAAPRSRARTATTPSTAPGSATSSWASADMT